MQNCIIEMRDCITSFLLSFVWLEIRTIDQEHQARGTEGSGFSEYIHGLQAKQLKRNNLWSYEYVQLFLQQLIFICLKEEQTGPFA